MGLVRSVYSHCSCSKSLSALRRASRSAGELAADSVAENSAIATSRQRRYRIATPEISNFVYVERQTTHRCAQMLDEHAVRWLSVPKLFASVGACSFSPAATPLRTATRYPAASIPAAAVAAIPPGVTASSSSDSSDNLPSRHATRPSASAWALASSAVLRSSPASCAHSASAASA